MRGKKVSSTHTFKKEEEHHHHYQTSASCTYIIPIPSLEGRPVELDNCTRAHVRGLLRDHVGPVDDGLNLDFCRVKKGGGALGDRR
jgi:hypothetical protein